jgi:hypothetical protein
MPRDISGAQDPRSIKRSRRSRAVTPDQIDEWKLPTRPTKTEADGNRHAKHFNGDSVELDAIPIDKLHDLIIEVIFRHLDPHQLRILREAEASEQELLNALGKASS